MSEQGRRTHLHEFHSKSGKIASFAGFNMPIWYKGITTEHLAVRNTVGLFDVTHMGRVLIKGSEAEAFLNFVTTNDVSKLQPLDAHYSTMCNENGGIKDDFVLSRQENDRFFMVYNAANRTKDVRWLLKQARARFKVQVEDVSENVAMFAVQGPKAQDTLQKITSEDVSSVTRFKCSWTELAGHQAFISRTGYTGEDGFEVFIWNTPTSNPKRAIDAWEAIVKAGEEYRIEPCGLGSRDTLRLEAGMCLYGNDIDENTTPLEARISFVVKLHKADFIGKQALLNQKTRGIERKRVGLRLLEAGIPRLKHEVFKNSEKTGYVTSGTFSPLLKQGIAMAYIKTEHAILGETVNIKIRDRKVEAKIVKFPFYDTQSYGHTRKN